jgi:hypothetical protein
MNTPHRIPPIQKLCARWAACLALVSCVTLIHRPSHADPTSPRAELGASAGVVHRVASADENPRGIGYNPALGVTVAAVIPIWAWLRIGAYYQRSSHSLDLPVGAVDVAGSSIDLGSVLAFSIGARIQPTLRPTDRLSLWASVGAGWGRITSPRMTVTSPTHQYTVQEREGVFVEVPFGIGGAYEIIARWLCVTLDGTWGPNYAQSGSLYDPIQTVDNQGLLQRSPSMPKVSSTFTQMVGLMLLL